MEKRRLFKNATIIDGTGKSPLIGWDLFVEGEKIVAIGKTAGINPEGNYESINLKGKYIVPGIINCHTHITYNYGSDREKFSCEKMSESLATINGIESLDQLLSLGVTYVRDLGAPRHVDLELKKARKANIIGGAELIAAGQAICMTGGHGWPDSAEVDGADEARKAARLQLKAGADCLKIMATGGHSETRTHPGYLQTAPDEMRAVAEVAHAENRKVAAHVSGVHAIKSVIDSGIDSVEHGHLFPYDDERLIDELISLMVARGTYYVPTLFTWFRKNYIPKYGVRGKINEDALNEREERIPEAQREINNPREITCMNDIIESFNKMYKAKVKIAMGTDSISHRFNHEYYPFELKLMVLGGMSAHEAILASTRDAAKLLGIDEFYGTLEKNKFADFVILNTDPLKDLDSFFDIYKVYKKGCPYKSEN